jgi:hypothetical protein
MSREQLDYLLSLVKGGMLERATTMIEQELAKPSIPTKIVGPNLEEILNAAGFYRGDTVCCNDYEKCIKPCTPKGEWLAKKELAKEEKLSPVGIGVDVTPEGTHVVAVYRRSDAVEEMFYSQFHLLTKPEQEPVRWFQQFGDSPPRKEWVGLSINEALDFFESKLTKAELITEISEFLEKKNT